MNTRKILRVLIPGSLALFLLMGADTNLNRDRFLSQLIHQSLENFHYSEKKVNDDFSARGLREYLDFLDYNKRYFLKSDIDGFRRFADKIDDELEAGRMDLMALASNRIRRRITEVSGFYRELLSRPFDFSKPEFFELDGEKREYCETPEQLRAYWRKILKYHSLLNYVNLLRAEDKAHPDGALEEKARKAVEKSFKSLFNSQLQAHRNDASQLYFNALVRVFDPHSNYLPPKEKEDFDIEMTGQFEGIGALLREEDGFVKVVRIIPGGPSWRQKELEPGDLILKVAQGDGEPVDIVGMRVVDAVKLIRGDKGSLVRLTVRKPEGQIVEIPIVRDVVIVEESFAKYALVKNSRLDRTFGYILLPRFYRDFSQPDGRNSTDDVRNIISRFNREGVDGVILDLRNNSGGSLIDAVNVSGLFISKGPIVQVKNRKRGIRVLRDRDRKINYKGPLVVMINALSASASEILAAALQDYGRAVIVGGNHSYGKGTVQIMIDLDRFLSQLSEDREKEMPESLGALKLTVQKFYRITGSSNQYRGVIPDVILPDRFDYLEIGEKYLDHSLSWDAIPSISYSRWESRDLNLEDIIDRSEKRVVRNPYFKRLKKYIQGLKNSRENTLKSLNFQVFSSEQKQVLKEQKKFERFQKTIPHLLVFRSAEEKGPGLSPAPGEATERQKVAAARLKEWLDQLREDFHLEEATMILNDIILNPR